MTKTSYGRAAIATVKLCAESSVRPPEAWEQATAHIFGAGTEGQKKGCPRDAFLGLCEEGRIRGIQKGTYTKSECNKAYAIEGLRLLVLRPTLAERPAELWRAVMKGERKRHNSQMHVVVALWNDGLLR